MQVDLCAEEMGNNVRPAVALLGDINATVTQGGGGSAPGVRP